MSSFGSAVDFDVYAVIVDGYNDMTLSREVTLFSSKDDARAYLKFERNGRVEVIHVRKRIE